MHDEYMLVDFEAYCKKCKYCDTKDTDEPCNECLEYPARQYSSKPEKFEEK